MTAESAAERAGFGITDNCVSGRHDECGGYIAPLVNANNRPCWCHCHSLARASGRIRLPVAIHSGETIEAYTERVRRERGFQ